VIVSNVSLVGTNTDVARFAGVALASTDPDDHAPRFQDITVCTLAVIARDQSSSLVHIDGFAHAGV
jgi:hypothetical protein